MRFLRSARWALLALLVCLIPASSQAGVFISVNIGPPILPVYVQPICPQPNLIWTPGYWAYGDEGYFWVPGAWVPAPFVGGLWTPGYWGWNTGLYVYHPGYWGYHVGYYGGVNYGGGYLGIGFAGGEWRGGAFAYNTAVVNVNTTIIHNTFVDRTVIERTTIVNDRHVAYSGGPGGIQHQPAPEERIAERETHTPPTSFQAQHISAAQTNHQSYAKFNGGHPATLAVARPLQVESRPAPARTAMAASANSRGGAAPMTARPNTSVNSNLPRTTEMKTNNSANTAVHPNTAPRTYEAPKTNARPPTNPKPEGRPKPEGKPKPEGHEK
jgi:hypothetical protein